MLDRPIAMNCALIGRVLAQREMRSSIIVVMDVRLHDPAKMRFTED